MGNMPRQPLHPGLSRILAAIWSLVSPHRRLAAAMTCLRWARLPELEGASAAVGVV